MLVVPRRALLAGLAALLTLVSAVLVALTSTAQAADPRDSFVTRCGIRFCLDGKPYYFAGANTYDVFTFGFDWLPAPDYVDKAKIDAHMARLQNDGVAVLRLWMFSHEDWQGFEAAEGVYTEEEFILFDCVIKSARDHNIRLIPVFENYWEAYGGIDTRLRWEGLPTGQANRWRFFNKEQCPGCFDQYKNYVRYALGRTNYLPASSGPRTRPSSPGS
jgi:mannan endo-1,4-beta-mannosidase